MTTTAITEIFGFIFEWDFYEWQDFDVNQYHPDEVGGFAYLPSLVTGVIMNGH